MQYTEGGFEEVGEWVDLELQLTLFWQYLCCVQYCISPPDTYNINKDFLLVKTAQ